MKTLSTTDYSILSVLVSDVVKRIDATISTCGHVPDDVNSIKQHLVSTLAGLHPVTTNPILNKQFEDLISNWEQMSCVEFIMELVENGNVPEISMQRQLDFQNHLDNSLMQ